MTHETHANPGTGREGKEEKERRREGGEEEKVLDSPCSLENLVPPLNMMSCYSGLD
jgi:hypothetical protein